MLCDGQESTQDYLERRLLSIMESVNWVCEEAFEVHEWVSELTISMQEEEILVALNYRIVFPCVVQWGMLWFSAPSRPNQRFDGNGTKMPCGGFDTPRACMLRSVAAVLDRAPDKDWDVGGEMIACGRADGLVLLLDDGVCGTDVSDE